MTEPLNPPPVHEDPVQQYPVYQPPSGESQSPPVRLRRSRQDRVLGGVCGGLGHYLGVDPVIIRIVAVALLFAGVGLLAYIVAWIIIPETAAGEPEPSAPAADRRSVGLVLGAALVAVGGLMVVQSAVPNSGHVVLWPLLVVAAGIAVLLGTRR
ncbi:MAG TPA: PspC domain-containing protein [Microlunatus sp.]|nr:PspC domain-containing protein [Microlunatus sp.]